MSKLFIPEKCRVGFQLRGGTFTGLLAYVIYYDAKGKIRKEVSWDGWRQSSETVTDRQLRYGFGIRDSVNPDLSQAFQLVAIYENGHEEPWRYW